MGVEKRKSARFNLNLTASVTVVEETGLRETPHDFHTRDISTTGGYFQNENALPLSSLVEIDLVLPLDQLKDLPGNRARVRLSGQVVRVQGNGMGVSFDEEYEIEPLSRDQE